MLFVANFLICVASAGLFDQPGVQSGHPSLGLLGAVEDFVETLPYFLWLAVLHQFLDHLFRLRLIIAVTLIQREQEGFELTADLQDRFQ